MGETAYRAGGPVEAGKATRKYLVYAETEWADVPISQRLATLQR